MKNQHYDLFEKYYRITVGKFYTAKQCRRLLSLLAASNGMELSAEEYSAILHAVETVEAHDISGFVESKNFQLLCDMLEEPPAVITAATALASVFEEMQNNKEPRYSGLVERAIALRTAVPRDNNVRMQLAYLEYALGDVEDAAEHLRDLVDHSCFEAVGHLAFLSMEAGDSEGAYHYLALLERIYSKELELEPESWIRNRMAYLSGCITPQKLASIRENIEKMPPFLTAGGAGGGSIGFNPNTVRRFTYEH